MILVIAASTAVVASFFVVVYAFWPDEGISARRRARKPQLSEYRSKQLSTSTTDRMIAPLMRSLTARGQKITPAGMINDNVRKLAIAGMSSKISIEAFLGVKMMAGLLGLMMAFAWAPVESFVNRIGFTLVAAGVGFILPDTYVSRKAEDRQKEIKASLPEVLDQLTIVVEAGLGFDSALKRVVSMSEGPLIDEFARSLRAMRLGLKRSEALEQIVQRTDVAEVRQFVSALKQADKLGVPIATVLRTQSTHMREIKRLKAEEAAMRLPVKLTFPMVFCMLPALFVLTLGPVVVRIAESGLTQ